MTLGEKPVIPTSLPLFVIRMGTPKSIFNCQQVHRKSNGELLTLFYNIFEDEPCTHTYFFFNLMSWILKIECGIFMYKANVKSAMDYH